MPTISRSLAFVFAALGASCRAPQCHGELDSDGIVRLQKAVKDGKDPCPEQLRPSIETTKTSVSLNAKVLSRDVAAPAGLTRIEPLFRELKNDREIWKQVHPDQEFRAQAQVRIDPDADSVLGASTLTTAAFAGYPYVHLTSGAVSVDFAYEVPRPPSSEERPHDHAELRCAGNAEFNLRFLRGSAVVAEFQAKILDQVPALVGDWCTHDSCIESIELHPCGSFLIQASLIDRILRVPEVASRKPSIKFATGT